MGQPLTHGHSEVTKQKAHVPALPGRPIPAENLGGFHSAVQDDGAFLYYKDDASWENLLDLVLRQSSQPAASVAKATAATKPPRCEARVAHRPEAQSLQQITALVGGEQKEVSQATPSSLTARAVRSSSFEPTPGAPVSASKTQAAPFQVVPAYTEGFQSDEHQQQEKSQESASSSKMQATQSSSSREARSAHYPHLEGLQQILDLFIGGSQQQVPQRSPHSSMPQPAIDAQPKFGSYDQFINALLGQREKEQQVNQYS